MEIRAFQKSDLQPLFAYWQTIGEKIPYFFPVSLEKWHACLLYDTVDDEPKFVAQKMYVAIENGTIIGFIQGVQSAYAWNEKGEKYPDDQIGIIRHFYHDEGRVEVAKLLLGKIEPFINQFPQQYAFYHIFGMSCNAHHGKLHASLWHVEPYLLGKGFEREHENVYYSLELKDHQVGQQSGLLVQKPNHRTHKEDYEIIAGDKLIGSLRIGFLDQVTGGKTADTVYLTLLRIKQEYRRQGWASQAMMVLTNELHSRGYKYLHTDTAGTNIAAQRLYESLGFVNQGRTRSYITRKSK
jgi:ribosomal protein S18 acetylase RimI-like enzyme